MRMRIEHLGDDYWAMVFRNEDGTVLDLILIDNGGGVSLVG